MRYLTLSKSGDRLVFVLENVQALCAAARSVCGARTEGTSDGMAIFSYPTMPEVWQQLKHLAPSVDERARAKVDQLEKAAAAITLANLRKGQTGGQLVFDGALRTTPMAHQVEAANFCWSILQAGVPGAALLMEQGTGKSLVAIALANGLFAQGRIGWALVLCPNSLKGTWGAEDGQVAEHSALGPEALVLRGTRPKRLAALRRGLGEPGFLWAITNYEQLSEDPRKSQHQRELQDLVRFAVPGLLICDESTMLKNPRAKRTRAVLELARFFPYRLILTGTPITKNPLDAWSQFEVLEPGCLGRTSYLAFERRHAEYQRQSVFQGGRRRTFSAVVGYKHIDELRERVAQRSYRVRAAECLDLPPVTVQRIPVEVGPAQDRALRDLGREMMAALDAGTLVDGRNILTRYLRMAQILGGHVKTLNPDGTPGPMETFNPNPKLDAAREFLQLRLEDPEAKAVVFAQFRPELDDLVQLCQDSGWGVGAIHGGVSEADRDAARQAFQRNPDCRVMVCQYQAGSKGLTLTAANTCLFYSLTFNLEDYLQARKRVHRIGQGRHVTEAYLLATHPVRRGRRRRTLDQVQLQALEEKRQLADLVTGDAARNLLEDLDPRGA